jgi:hypothetical protein
MLNCLSVSILHAVRYLFFIYCLFTVHQPDDSGPDWHLPRILPNLQQDVRYLLQSVRLGLRNGSGKILFELQTAWTGPLRQVVNGPRSIFQPVFEWGFQ